MLDMRKTQQQSVNKDIRKMIMAKVLIRKKIRMFKKWALVVSSSSSYQDEEKQPHREY